MRTSLTVKIIRLATALIPVKRVRRRLRDRWMAAAREHRLARMLPVVRARYAAHETACREKLARGERLRVAFLVCDASMFSGESVFLKMREDPRYDCFIAVAPRVTRGEAFLRDTLKKTVGELGKRYPQAVRALYDPDAGKAEKLDADLVFSTILYEDQTLPDYTTERLSARSLVAILYYGYGGLFISNEKKTPYLPNIVFAWRYFVSNEATRLMSIEKNPLLAENAVTVGYAKMDRLATIPRRERAGKTILLCPHHTLDKISGDHVRVPSAPASLPAPRYGEVVGAGEDGGLRTDDGGAPERCLPARRRLFRGVPELGRADPRLRLVPRGVLLHGVSAVLPP